MPSASGTIALLLLLSGLLAGCSTTQDTSARLKVKADRILASRHPVEVGAEDPNVRALDATVIRGHGRAAVVVTIRNSGPKPLADLPILVEVRTAGEDVPLNRGHTFGYFEAHTPGLAPHRDTTWVLTVPAKKLPAGRPEVRIGRPKGAPTVAGALPDVAVGDVKTGRSTVRARVDNDAGFPQYDLAVYAWAKRDGRFVAAAQKSVGDLGTGKGQTVRLDLIGDPGRAKVHVSAPPTIFE